MKFISLFTLLLLICIAGQAQKIEKYYDYSHKESEVLNASFYSSLELTDSGWLRRDYYVHRKKLEKQALYEDSSCTSTKSPARNYYPNGYLESVGKVKNGKRNGAFFSYHSNGMMRDSGVFAEDKLIGVYQRWARNGYRIDSAYYNADGSGIEYEWFDDGTPSAAGRYAANYKKTGKWAYYHPNGQISSVETYSDDALQVVQLFNDGGQPLSDTSNRMNRPAIFPGGPEAWSKYLDKNLYFPEQYRIVNGQVVVVVVTMTVYEDGSVKDVEVEVPFHPDFEKIALNVVKRSPKWAPAIMHNRAVKSYMRMRVSFDQNNYY